MVLGLLPVSGSTELLVQAVVLEGGGGGHSSGPGELPDPQPGDPAQDGAGAPELHPAAENGQPENDDTHDRRSANMNSDEVIDVHVYEY